MQKSGNRSIRDEYIDDVEIYDDDDGDEFDDIMHSPKRRKLRTTSRYIFETLFVEGKDSDITFIALNREWKLHKVSCTKNIVSLSQLL